MESRDKQADNLGRKGQASVQEDCTGKGDTQNLIAEARKHSVWYPNDKVKKEYLQCAHTRRVGQCIYAHIFARHKKREAPPIFVLPALAHPNEWRRQKTCLKCTYKARQRNKKGLVPFFPLGADTICCRCLFSETVKGTKKTCIAEFCIPEQHCDKILLKVSLKQKLQVWIALCLPASHHHISCCCVVSKKRGHACLQTIGPNNFT